MAHFADVYRGLDLSRPDLTTPEELAAYFADSDQPGGRPLANYELFASVRPDMLKRTFTWSRALLASETFKCSLPYLNVYAVGGWVEGVRYQLGLLQPGTFVTQIGFSRETIVETLAVSFYLAPSWGTVETANCAKEILATYQDPDPSAPSPFPAGWAADPKQLRAGLDYSTPRLTAEDWDALTGWYERICGEVPRSVELYAKYRPMLLKAERNRWENIVRTGLPNQMFGYLLLHYEIWRCNVPAARDALRLCRGLGMSKEIAIDAIWYAAAFFGGQGTIATVVPELEDILESWPQPSEIED